MKKISIKAAGLLTGAALCLSYVPSLTAGPNVKRVDQDTLQIVDYSGKPPFSRRYITLHEGNADEFARYEDMLDYDNRPLFATSERAGPPGKNLPQQRMRVGEAAEEEVEFARFEEDGEAEAQNHRMWRGAPGKSRTRLAE